MPRVAYTKEYKTADATEFPQLKLAPGEKARIWMPELPWMEWYHRIEAPLIEHGVPVKEVREGKNGLYEATKMEWIGSPFCLGVTGTPQNPGPLMQGGLDPDNCPACESAANGTGIQPPQQRFAANVVKYKVRAGTYDLIIPPTAEILVWAFTARIYATLYELQQEYGTLSKLDIKLELEDSRNAAQYQKMKQIGVVITEGHAVPAYADPRVREYLQELWSKHPEYRATDEQLRAACKGRDVPRNVVMDMVRRAEHQWRQAQQAGTGQDSAVAAAADTAFNGSLADGLSSLLDSSPVTGPDGGVTAAAVAEAPAHPGGIAEFSPDPLTDPFGDVTPAAGGAPATGTAAPVAPPASGSDSVREQAVEQAAVELFGASGSLNGSSADPAAPAGGKVIDFDDLFKD